MAGGSKPAARSARSRGTAKASAILAQNHSDRNFPCYPNLVLGLKIVHPEQVWVCDITYIRLQYGFVYLALIVGPTLEIKSSHARRFLIHTTLSV